MSVRWVLTGGSVLAHAGIVLALGEIRPLERSVATAVQIVEVPSPEPAAPATEPEPPPPPPPAADPPLERPAAPQASHQAAPPPDAAPKAEQAPADLPDFGLELSGGGEGPGLAVARPRETSAPPPRTAQKTLTPESPARRAASDPCEEERAKPKLVHLPQPTYTEAARAAGAEGRVRVQMTVDEAGKVVDVKTLAGLGYGLDEAALQAARAATFEAAIRCGKPARSTFTVAIRFSAS